MRLTPEHVKSAAIRVNPAGDREICLRGIGIRQLDETALSQLITTSNDATGKKPASKAQQAWSAVCDEEVDAIDLCDNLLGTLDSVPTMRRLHTLILHRNVPLQRISSLIATRLPSLHTLVASGCGFTTLASLAPLSGCRNLERVCFSLCPVSIDTNRTPYNARELLGNINHNFSDALLAEISSMEPSAVYRLYLIAICSPTLKLVDFERVKDAERERAKQLKDVLVALAAATSGSVLLSTSAQVSDAPTVTADGRKIRKRSTLATGGATASTSQTGDAEVPNGNGGKRVEEEELTEEGINRKRDELNARIESASTMEEMEKLEEEMEKLAAKELQLKKIGAKRQRD